MKANGQADDEIAAEVSVPYLPDFVFTNLQSVLTQAMFLSPSRSTSPKFVVICPQDDISFLNSNLSPTQMGLQIIIYFMRI